MNTETIHHVARATLDGSVPFPELVGRLMAVGVEYYHVDYVGLQTRFYGGSGQELGAVVATPLPFEGLPAVARDWDVAALQAAIVDSQQHGQTYRAFTERAMRAGVQSYTAYLRGQRVTYNGRAGDSHTEWFPGSQP